MATTYPANADTIIVQHYWWDDATRAGVAASVSWTPLPFTGAATPNLVDSTAHGWIKTKAWTCRPDPTTGYLAVPLTASNDPDLTAFPGYRVAPDGESTFTIAVDVNAPTVPATAQMAAALAALSPSVSVSVGQPVKAVWLTDVALAAPSPTPPASFFTATQTTDLVLDAVAAHDTDPQAHPDIRALIGSGSGGGGGGSPSGGAGGVLSGSYPNPGFAVDMATQAELDAVAAASRSYVHTQSTAAATWTITHNLGRYPQVTVVDGTGARMFTDLAYPSANAVTVVHAAPLAGKAYLI